MSISSGTVIPYRCEISHKLSPFWTVQIVQSSCAGGTGSGSGVGSGSGSGGIIGAGGSSTSLSFIGIISCWPIVSTLVLRLFALIIS